MDADSKPEPFDAMAAIQAARRQIADETHAFQKRIEFWNGYITAMEEVDRTLP
jgi:hypothetical protein